MAIGCSFISLMRIKMEIFYLLNLVRSALHCESDGKCFILNLIGNASILNLEISLHRGADDLVVCARRCTRPRPFFDRRCQSGLHRIPFHIPDDSLKLNLRPNPVVVRLVLPKCFRR
jgi:hypothetical protein